MRDEEHTPPVGEESPADPRKAMSMQALIERNEELERKVEELEADKRQLKRYIRRSRRMFPREFREWERMEKELKKLREVEEKPTLEEVEVLKKSLCKVNMENLRKEAVLKRLKARLAKREREMTGDVEVGLVGNQTTEAEGRNAADIFPEEIWQMILFKVEDPQDRWSCYNACPLFRRILHQWKTTWVFEKALPHLFPHLPTEKLLKCRLVSKGWKEEVDELLQNHPSLRPHNEDTCNPRLLSFVDPQREKGLAMVTKFLFVERAAVPVDSPLRIPPNFESSHRHILLRRSLILKIDLFEEAEDRKNVRLWELIHALLRRVGGDMWYLNLYFWSDGVPSRWVKRKLLKFLGGELFQFVPNLRKLTIEHIPNLGEVEVDDLAGIPAPASLPLLPLLETVETEVFGGGCAYYPVLLRVLKRYHTQLGRLRLDDVEGVWTEAYQLSWPTLTELHLNVSSVDQLAILPQMDMPNLAKLGLAFIPAARFEFQGDEMFPRLLQMLDLLSASTRLSTLRLDASGIKMLKVLGKVPMAVGIPSTLKTLELDYNNAIPHQDYRFLLYFPHLENLNIFVRALQLGGIYLRSGNQLDADVDRLLQPSGFEGRMAKLDREQEVVEVNKYMYSGEMYKSNIWELLPRLKVFTFQWEVYTRGGYEDYCRKKRVGG